MSELQDRVQLQPSWKSRIGGEFEQEYMQNLRQFLCFYGPKAKYELLCVALQGKNTINQGTSIVCERERVGRARMEGPCINGMACFAHFCGRICPHSINKKETLSL